jgi:hypothetical protein
MQHMTKRTAGGLAGAAFALGLATGCPPVPTTSPDGFANTTDPSNGGASYVGGAACRSCHPDIAELDRLHGHGQALKPVFGAAPRFPAGAGVPITPLGLTFMDVSYLLGGYIHNAFYIDIDGFVLTDGVLGTESQYVLALPAIGRDAGLAEYLPEVAEPKPFGFECIRCHTTGPQPFTPERPLNQDNRPGIQGTWVEAGVQCEACHGPGSRHVNNPAARDLYVNSSVELCQQCHLSGDDVTRVEVANGFIKSNTQAAELRASGGHSDFDCGFCHDPHASSRYDRTRGIRNDCTVCHGDVNLAAHAGAVFTRGDYVEVVTCESCHMPLPGSAAPPRPSRRSARTRALATCAPMCSGSQRMWRPLTRW